MLLQRLAAVFLVKFTHLSLDDGACLVLTSLSNLMSPSLQQFSLQFMLQFTEPLW